MRVLLVDSSYPVNNRNIKILNSLKKRFSKNIEIFVCAWNRDDRLIDDHNDFHLSVFSKRVGYGKPMSKMLGIKPYWDFIKKINQNVKPEIIIASHWDVLVLLSLIKSSEQKLIYENLDMPTSSKSFFRGILRSIERFALKRTDAIIFASRFFVSHYVDVNKTKIILENLPFKDVSLRENIHSYESDKLKVSFIGTLRYFNVMKNLIDGANRLPIDILFWGDGPDSDLLKTYSINNDSVKFFGKYNYRTISDIYALSDIVWAVYPSLDYNVKYAISNKFYECLLFNRPGVFAEKTMLGDLVKGNQIGYTVDPYSASDIRKLFESIIKQKEQYNIIKNNLANSKEKRNWEDDEEKLVNLFSKLYSDINDHNCSI